MKSRPPESAPAGAAAFRRPARPEPLIPRFTLREARLLVAGLGLLLLGLSIRFVRLRAEPGAPPYRAPDAPAWSPAS